MEIFEGNTANEAWLKAAARFRAGEGVRVQSSRAGSTRELLRTILAIQNPRQRWTTARQPAVNPAFAIAEVVWIVSGRNDADFLNFWNPKLPTFAGNAKYYHGAYGYRLRRHFRVDQLTRAYETLLRNPDSRQVVLQIWDARVDMPLKDGTPANKDIPCNICSLVKIRDGRLEWTQILRSNDLFLGVPHNFVQFTSLQEILAGWLGVEVGSYQHFADSLHVYERDLECVEGGQTDNATPNSDVIRFSKNESDELFQRLSDSMDRMRSARLSKSTFLRLVRNGDFPESLQNWLLVVAADAARRRQWIDLTFDIMSDCTNHGLKELWENWFSRWWSASASSVSFDDASLYAQPFLPFELSFG